MAAVAGASAIAMFISTSDAKHRAEYVSSLRTGEVAVSLQSVTGVDPQQVVAKLGAALPFKRGAVVSAIDYQSGTSLVEPQIIRNPGNECPQAHSGAEYLALQKDPRCLPRLVYKTNLGMSAVSSGGPDVIKVMTGTDNPAADDVLSRGGVVVFSPNDLATPVPNATVKFGVVRHGCPQPGDTPPQGYTPPPGCSQAAPTVTLPAVLVSMPKPSTFAVVAPGALDKLGVNFVPENILIDTFRMPTSGEQQKADDAAAALGINNPVLVERGYEGTAFAGLLALAAVAGVITLGAAAVATGLAITDAQSDLETLAAVGARPRVRRTLAGAQAAVTAGLGAVLGAAFGLIPAVGLIEAQVHGFAQALAQSSGTSDQFHPGKAYLTVPWLFLGIVIVALPALAAVGSSVFTRSRIELRRRRA
jgi:putative ABC transport system permease protein